MEVLPNSFYGMHGKVVVCTNYQDNCQSHLRLVVGTYTRALRLRGSGCPDTMAVFYFSAWQPQRLMLSLF